MSRRTRGYALIEIVVTLGLIAVLGTMASRLMVGLLTTGRDLDAADREGRALDAAVTALRHDVERATNVAAAGDGVSLGSVTWEARHATLVRRENDRERRFGPLPAEVAAIETDGGRVILRADDATWAWRPVAERGTR